MAILVAEVGHIGADRTQRKMQMAESEKGERVEPVNAYIAEQLACFKQKTDSMEDDRKADWQNLNRLFLELVSSPACRQ